MQATYYVRAYNHEGVAFDHISTWASLKYTRTINNVGSYELTLNYPYANKALWATDTIVELWRTASGTTYCDFVGFHRGWTDTLTDARRRLVTSRGVSLEHLIQRRRILYPAVTAQTLKSGPGETVIKEFVNENLGPGAGGTRIINGICPWLTIEADQLRGTDWFGQAAYVSLLDTIKDIGMATKVYFHITRIGVQAFQFGLMNPIIRPQVFSESANTLLTFDLARDAANVTAAVALGAEIGATRTAVSVVDPAALDSPWNLSETAIDVNMDTYNDLLQAAQTEVERGKASQSLTMRINPKTPAIYGVDYNLGDVLTTNIRGELLQQRLTSVSITVEEGRERLEHTFEAYP